MQQKIIIILAIILIAVIPAGCTSNIAPPMPMPPLTPTPPESWQLLQGTVTPTVSVDGNDTFVTGNINGNVTIPMVEGGYYFSFKFKNNLQFTPENRTDINEGLVSRSNAFNYTDGAYNNYNMMSRVLHWNSTGNQTFAIEATGPFQVVISKLPLSFVVYPQQRANSSGWLAYYPPIQYNEDTANISVVCSDTKHAQFNAVLKDGSSGYTLSIIAMNNENGSLSKDVNVTKTLNIPKNGSYILEVRADRDENYSISEQG